MRAGVLPSQLTLFVPPWQTIHSLRERIDALDSLLSEVHRSREEVKKQLQDVRAGQTRSDAGLESLQAQLKEMVEKRMNEVLEEMAERCVNPSLSLVADVRTPWSSPARGGRRMTVLAEENARLAHSAAESVESKRHYADALAQSWEEAVRKVLNEVVESSLHLDVRLSSPPLSCALSPPSVR